MRPRFLSSCESQNKTEGNNVKTKTLCLVGEYGVFLVGKNPKNFT